MVSPHRIITSEDISRTLSMGQGCVVKVEEEDTKVTWGGNKGSLASSRWELLQRYLVVVGLKQPVAAAQAEP